VDDDRDVAEVVQAFLTDEGYRVSCLYDTDDNAVARAVGQLEPDVVLLDSASRSDYGEAWKIAGALNRRGRRVPVVMFTAHQAAVREAEAGTSARARDAGFAAIISKPFHLDDLLTAIAKAAGRSIPFDRSRSAETLRTKALVKTLEARGATEIRPSTMREWALFRDMRGSLVQLYWWQLHGVYQLGRYTDKGILRMIGQFTELEAAIDLALPRQDPQ
jgi:CheY-like chemotaxis protein